MLRWLGVAGAAHQHADLDLPVELDLEEWRRSKGLTYGWLAALLGIESGCQMRRYCLGEAPLKVECLERVLKLTRGEVGLYALHRRRVAWLQERGMWSLSAGCECPQPTAEDE